MPTSNVPDVTQETGGGGGPGYTLRQLALYFLKLGAIGFGGPVALVGYMYRDLVERRGWLDDATYNEGLALSQLAPGPLAAQLSFYLGFAHYGLRGAAVAGVAFIAPSFLMVLALGWAYQRFGSMAWIQAVFYGVGAAVIGIISVSAYHLGVRTAKRDWLLWVVYASMLLTTALTEKEYVELILLGGLLVWFLRAPPRLIRNRSMPALGVVPVGVALAARAEPNALVQLALFFAKAGAFVFGSGLAIVPFLYGGVVHDMHWLNDRQFVDAVAVAMITPGPVVITAGFIGYIVAGVVGAIVASSATFLPCFLVTVVGAPHFRRWGKSPAVLAFITGVTAAAMGAIAGAVIVLGRRSVVDVATALIAVVTAIVLFRFRRVPEAAIVVIAAVVGLLLRQVLLPWLGVVH